MNKVLKYVGLVAILPLFTLALSLDYIDNAEAGPSNLDVKAGPATPFKLNDGAPFLKQLSVTKFSGVSPDTYRATFMAYSGGNDLTYVQILVKSDSDSELTSIAGISAHASSVATVIIQAKDPGSVSGQILGWQIND